MPDNPLTVGHFMFRLQKKLHKGCLEMLCSTSLAHCALIWGYTDLSLSGFFDFNLCQQNLNSLFFQPEGLCRVLTVTCYTNKHDKSYKYTRSQVFDKSFWKKCHIYSTDMLIHIVKWLSTFNKELLDCIIPPRIELCRIESNRIVSKSYQIKPLHASKMLSHGRFVKRFYVA